ncbi:hypothetical protein V1282_001431 [Nitrobacteraceae bacterium AZCC 2146]
MHHQFFGANSNPFWAMEYPFYGLDDLFIPTADGKTELLPIRFLVDG